MTKLWRRWDRNTHTDRRSSRWVHPNRRDGNGRSKPAKEHEHENGLRPLRRDGRNLDGRHVHPDVPSDLSARARRIQPTPDVDGDRYGRDDGHPHARATARTAEHGSGAEWGE